MGKKFYLCTNDYNEIDNNIVGKAMTISAWKKWMVKTKLEWVADIGGGLFDKQMTADIMKMLDMEEEHVIRFVRDYFDLRIIPLEDSDIKFIDMDANGKLMCEDELRKMCLELEQADLFNNFNDYKHNNLDLSIHFDWIKKCLYGDINDVLDEISNFGAWIKQIEFIK